MTEEHELRDALESGDYVSATSALERYVAWFQSESRTTEETARAKELLEWSLQAAYAGKRKLAVTRAFVSGSDG